MKSIRKTTLVLLAGGLTFFRRASARGLQVKAAAVFIGSVLCLSAPGRASADPIVLDFFALCDGDIDARIGDDGGDGRK